MTSPSCQTSADGCWDPRGPRPHFTSIHHNGLHITVNCSVLNASLIELRTAENESFLLMHAGSIGGMTVTIETLKLRKISHSSHYHHVFVSAAHLASGSFSRLKGQNKTSVRILWL